MEMNEDLYRKRFRQYSNAKLIEVLENRSKYELPAIKAAEAELNSRNLSEEAINEERKNLELKQEDSNQLKKTASSLSTILKSKMRSFFELINPVQKGVPTNENLIKVACIAFAILYVYPAIRNIIQFWFFLNGPGKVGLEEWIAVVPGLAPIVIILPFFFKKKIGWILMTMFATYILMSFLCAIYTEFFILGKSRPYFGNAIQYPSVFRYIYDVLFFTGLLIFLFRAPIREIYSITMERAIISVVTIVGFTLIVFYKLVSH